MHIPSKPIGQDPVSKMLWFIAKELEQLTGIMGKINNQVSSTTTTTTTL